MTTPDPSDPVSPVDSLSRAKGEIRASRVVCTWLGAQLKLHGLKTLLVVGSETPEGLLLVRWLDQEGLAHELAPGGRSMEHTVADARLDTPDLLPLLALHKSAVLLDGAPVGLIPLGDLWAEDVCAWVGGCSLPQGIQDGRSLFAIEAAIREGLRDNSLRRSLAAMQGEGNPDLETRLRRAAAFNRGPCIPKLEAFTVGMDLLLS